MTKVVFLDIDGPMIPATMFLVDHMCSPKRIFPQTTVAVINYLCQKSGAKIVFNTTHNSDWEGVDPIQIAITKQGLSVDHIHVDCKTKYPQRNRNEAVLEWLARHPEVEQWVALDDSKFTEDKRLIWVDPYCGVHIEHLNEALEQFGENQCLILM